MSSIIIKGMKMPQNCESCPMCHRRFDGYRQEARLACYAVEDWAEEEEGRLDNCPLIELPPHEIGYDDCANALLKMWMDNVLTDGEYYRIADKLNEKWGKTELPEPYKGVTE